MAGMLKNQSLRRSHGDGLGARSLLRTSDKPSTSAATQGAALLNNVVRHNS